MPRMIIDSHMHLVRKKNIDAETFNKLKLSVPNDTDLDTLVTWFKESGVKYAVAMGQDMSRIWKTNFAEEYLLNAFKKYPDFFIPLASIEPIDEANMFHRKNFEYFEKAITEYGFKGVLLTPPYGQYHSNDKDVYPFYQKAQEYGVVVQFHHSAAGGPPILAPRKYADLYDLNDLTIDFPELKIVIEHLGYPNSEMLFTLMVNDKNLWSDVAMLFARPMWLVWNLVLAKEYKVIDRIMFASDFVAANYDYFSADPVNDFRTWIDFIENGMNKICKKCGWPIFSEEEINGILIENAARLYKLDIS